MTAPTVRKYSRSLSDAFPDERASSGDWEKLNRSSSFAHWVVEKFCLWGLVILVLCLLTGVL